MKRALALTALLLVGCGGGDKGGDKATYEKDGQAICADYRTAIARLGQPTTVTELGPYIAKAMPVLTRTVRRLERLDPPSDLAGEYAAFRDAARQTVDRARALRDAAAKADGPEVQRLLKEAAQASRRRDALAKAAGLEACSQV